MDIQIQHKQKMNKFKGRNSNKNNRNKFIGVRQRPSGRWVAEIKDTTQKIRMWLGTFETAEAAACAYDEAACLLRGSNTRTNFVTHVSANSPLASRIKNLLKSKQGSEEKHILETSTTNTSFTTRSTSGVDFFQEEKVDDHSQLFDDAYKPDLGNCIHEFDLSASYESNVSWGLENSGAKISFAQEMWELPKNVMAEASNPEVEFSEFEHIKVERQISASLSAMNGVQEYMDSVHDPCDSIWNLPDLCSLFC